MIKSMLLKTAALIVPAAIALGAPTARAQVVVAVEPPVVEIAPPAAYIATAQPEYYEGRPVYFYNDHWYYRDHGRWGYYRGEPGYLRDRRAHWAHERGYVRGTWNGHERVYVNRYHYRR